MNNRIVRNTDAKTEICSLLFQDKVHIPGAFYLSVKFDSRCQTEEGCDELQLASSADFQQDLHTFSGSYHKWADVEIPGIELVRLYSPLNEYLARVVQYV